MSELTNADENAATATPAVDTEHTGSEEARPRFRVWQLLVLVAGVVVMAGALGFVAMSSSDQDEARASQRHAEHVLVVHQLARQDAKQKFDGERSSAGAMSRSAHFALPMLQGILTTADQEVSESQTMQRLGADLSTSDADFFASTQRYDALVAQYRAQIDAFITAENAMPPTGSPN
jgi:Tfp pilus assembly protein PilV